MCFPWAWIIQMLILAVVVIATIAILRLVVPWIISKAGIAVGDGLNLIVAVLRIALWAFVAIVVILFCAQIISCLWGFVGMGSLLPHR